MRGVERHGAINLKIGGHRKLARYRLNGDVMDGKAEIARDHHDALAHGLVVERARLRGDGDLGVRHVGAYFARQPILDCRDTIERQRSADGDAHLDEQHRARGPCPHPFDRDNAWHLARDCRNAFADAFRCGIGEGADGAAAEPKGGDGDENRDDDCRRGIGP